MPQLLALILVLGGWLLSSPSAMDASLRVTGLKADAGSNSDPDGRPLTKVAGNNDPNGAAHTDAGSDSDPNG